MLSFLKSANSTEKVKTNAVTAADISMRSLPAAADMLASSPSPIARQLLVLNSPKWSRVGEHFANVIVKIKATVRICWFTFM